MQIGDTGFDFADVVDEAVARSGGLSAQAADILKLRRGLRLLTEAWNADGYNLWRVTDKVLILSGVTPSLGLPQDVDDVINLQVRAPGAEGGSSTIRISEAAYAQLSNKQTQGQPSQFLVRRTPAPKLFVHPAGVPGVSYELTVTYVARPDRFRRYDNVECQEIAGRWLEALVIGLALHRARTTPPYDEGLIKRLDMEYKEAEDRAQRGDRGRQRFRYRIRR